MGQSPSCYREQNVWSSYSVGNDRDDERVKGTGMGKEKTEEVEKYGLGSLQRSKDIADEAKEPRENNSTHTVGAERAQQQRVGYEQRGIREPKGSNRNTK